MERARHGGTERPFQFLDVEMTDDQARILAPAMQDLSVQAILKDVGGEGATKKLAKRKLNTAGKITSHCGLQNHPERVKKTDLRPRTYGVSCRDLRADQGEQAQGQVQSRHRAAGSRVGLFAEAPRRKAQG